MKIIQPATAGTLESSDVLVQVLPAELDELEIDVKSDVSLIFGKAIDATIRDVLSTFEINAAKIHLVDKGALDCTLRARLSCALCRAASVQYDWEKQRPASE